jgi:hypothetical protein
VFQFLDSAFPVNLTSNNQTCVTCKPPPERYGMLRYT